MTSFLTSTAKQAAKSDVHQSADKNNFTNKIGGAYFAPLFLQKRPLLFDKEKTDIKKEYRRNSLGGIATKFKVARCILRYEGSCKIIIQQLPVIVNKLVRILIKNRSTGWDTFDRRK